MGNGGVVGWAAMKNHIHNLKGLQSARQDLRKRITPEEELLWGELRNNKLGCRF
jgi:very-short-patch-repair endonuclease